MIINVAGGDTQKYLHRVKKRRKSNDTHGIATNAENAAKQKQCRFSLASCKSEIVRLPGWDASSASARVRSLVVVPDKRTLTITCALSVNTLATYRNNLKEANFFLRNKMSRYSFYWFTKV